jgi:hypothetical protein
MVKGFKATLFAGVITFGAFAPAYAAAPVISGLPDIQIGDLEDAGASDSNLFVFSDAFSFSDYVTDADTPDNQLKWSFGEFTNPAMSAGNQDSQYAINGVTAINKGTAAIAADELAGNPLAKNPGASQINASSDLASFRDIVFSPGTGSGPFGDPAPADAAAAAAGKALRFYVADPEQNLGYQDVLIETVDDEFDMLTGTDGYQEVVRETFDEESGWKQSGIDSAEVDISSSTLGRLDVIVQPAQGRSRIMGWINENVYPYDSVGATKFLRGKFYISTSNAAAAPVNEVPNFRIRVTQEGAVNGSAHFEYAQTGYTDPGYEPFYGLVNDANRDVIGATIRPSSNGDIPSIYKVDLDPIDVPSAAGSNIVAQFESYTAQDPANATLSLREFALSTYDELSDADGDLVWSYDRVTGVAGGVGGAKSFSVGAFNHEANFQPGRRQALFLPTRDTTEVYATGGDQGLAGLEADTDPVSQDVFGIALMNIQSTDLDDRLRVEAGKLYRTRFYATSEVPTDSDNPAVESQGNIRFRFQTATGSVTYFQETSTLAGFDLTPKGNMIAAEAMPGIGSANPDTDPTLDTVGEDGGWYTVLAPSPLDPNAIREDLNDDFGAFAAAPGPGVNAESARDVTLGVDLIQIPDSLVLSPELEIPFARPNRVQIRLSAVRVYSYPSIDDGGYDYVAD